MIPLLMLAAAGTQQRPVKNIAPNILQIGDWNTGELPPTKRPVRWKSPDGSSVKFGGDNPGGWIVMDPREPTFKETDEQTIPVHGQWTGDPRLLEPSRRPHQDALLVEGVTTLLRSIPDLKPGETMVIEDVDSKKIYHIGLEKQK